MTIHILKEFANKTIFWAEKYFSGKYGYLKLVLATFLLALFSGFPSYDVMLKGQTIEDWNAVLAQTAHPLTQRDYPPELHQASITLRLTPPLIGKALGLQRAGYLVLQHISLLLLLYFLIGITQGITQDIASTVFVAFGFASIYVGNGLAGDIYARFDVLAYCLLAAAMYWSNPFLIFLAVFLASFTDERALVASGLVFFFWIIKKADIKKLRPLDFFTPNKYALAVVVSDITYLFARFLLGRFFSLKTQIAGVGLRTAVEQTNALPFALWTGLEGFWLIVIVAALLLYKQRQLSPLILGAMLASAVCLGAMCVLDITRSMAFVFPVALIGLHIALAYENSRFLRYLTLCSGAICLLPTYYIGEEKLVQWVYPLPVQILRMLFH